MTTGGVLAARLKLQGTARTYCQEFGNRHFLLVSSATDISQRPQLHCRRARGHQHHGEPQHRVIAKNVRFGCQGADDGNTHTAFVSMGWRGYLRKWSSDLHRPEDEANQERKRDCEWRQFARGLSTAHALQADCELDADDNYLQRNEQLSNVLQTGRQPGLEDASLGHVVEEDSVQRRRNAQDDADNGADARGAEELADPGGCRLQPRGERVPNSGEDVVGVADGRLLVAIKVVRQQRSALVRLAILTVLIVLVAFTILGKVLVADVVS